jgi:Ca2+-binding RTX toxin-like protein
MTQLRQPSARRAAPAADDRDRGESIVKRRSAHSFLPALAAAGLAAFGFAVGGGGAAVADSSCSRNGSTLQVSIGSGEAVSIVRSGEDFDVTGPGISDSTCGGADMHNIQIVTVDGAGGDETLTLDLSGGQFEPGAGAGAGSAPSASEIEFIVDLLDGGADAFVLQGSDGVDVIRLGGTGVNVNNDNDADVGLSNVELVTVNGGKGNDVLSGAGGEGTGVPFPGPLTVNGDSDRDILTGGDAADVENGGAGNDLFFETPNAEGADVFNGGPGKDKVDYENRSNPVQVIVDGLANDGEAGEGDRVGADVEGAIGGSKADLLDGGILAAAVANVFDGRNGNDTLLGRDGKDSLTGSGGVDNLQGGRGDDLLDARDGVGDETVDGGSDTDTCLADRNDNVSNCEA